MDQEHRSGCPINLTVEILGDRWSLVILRDIALLGKRHFRELLESDEGISSNILSDRLKMLVDEGMLTRSSDPTHKQKVIYSLTEKSITLVPVLAQIAIWGMHQLPVSEGPRRLVEQLEAGGPAYWDQIMDELRREHLDRSEPVAAATAS
jgi:DNA-binding HxlR family transcriptional regulator